MAVSDEHLVALARAGLEAAEDAFWEYGQSPNAAVLVNAAGGMTFVEYAGVDDRRKIAIVAMLHRAVTGVMFGESYFRMMSPEEHAAREPVSLADDPLAREQVFALAVKPGDHRGFVIAKEIIREDGGAVRLEALREEWQEELRDSWLRDILEAVFTVQGDEIREVRAGWEKARAERVVNEAWGMQ